MMLSRRNFLAVSGSLGLGACSSRARSGAEVPRANSNSKVLTVGAIERQLGGRLGVHAINVANGQACGYRANERFAMASTFKWILGAALLEEVHSGRLSLDEQLSFGRDDLLEWAPVTSEHVEVGTLSLETLGRAAVASSDNTAANLILDRIGGPARLTQFVREHGDSITRLDRREPELNENAPGDERDTTTPRAMAELLQELLCRGGLAETSRATVESWMQGATTGANRLRAGLPKDWNVGTKSGSGRRNAVNDVAIARPPSGGPLVIACYTSGGTASLATHESAHVQVARALLRQLDVTATA